jgi:hypothetical protein
MTKLLELAIEEATKLPASEQDAIGSLVLDEIKSENEWNKRFRANADNLRRAARAALEELKAGRTEELDPDNL